MKMSESRYTYISQNWMGTMGTSASCVVNTVQTMWVIGSGQNTIIHHLSTKLGSPGWMNITFLTTRLPPLENERMTMEKNNHE